MGQTRSGIADMAVKTMSDWLGTLRRITGRNLAFNFRRASMLASLDYGQFPTALGGAGSPVSAISPRQHDVIIAQFKRQRMTARAMSLCSPRGRLAPA
jgi:hypothetical protein